MEGFAIQYGLFDSTLETEAEVRAIAREGVIRGLLELGFQSDALKKMSEMGV